MIALLMLTRITERPLRLSTDWEFNSRLNSSFGLSAEKIC